MVLRQIIHSHRIYTINDCVHLIAGNPALRQGKQGFGVGFGYGLYFNTDLGQIRVDYAINAFNRKTIYFGINSSGARRLWETNLSLDIELQFKLILDIEGVPQVSFLTVCSGHASRIILFLYAGIEKLYSWDARDACLLLFIVTFSLFSWSVAEQIVPIRYVLNCSKGTLNTL